MGFENPFEKTPTERKGEWRVCDKCNGEKKIKGEICDKCKGSGRLPDRH